MERIETEKAFISGYLLAVANIVHATGDILSASEVLREAGVERGALDDLDLTDFDLNALGRVFDRIENEND